MTTRDSRAPYCIQLSYYSSCISLMNCPNDLARIRLVRGQHKLQVSWPVFFSEISVYWLRVEGRGMTWRYRKKCYLNLVLQKKSFKSLNAMRIRKVLHWIFCFLLFQIDLKGLSFFQPYLSFCSSWQCASRPQKISSHQV